MNNLFPTLLFLLSFIGVPFASDWKQEVNGRRGFVLTYPGSPIPERFPIMELVRNYHSTDHQVNLVAMDNHTHSDDFGENLDDFWKAELFKRGETVTYKFKKDNFYVISGVNPNGY